MKAQLPRRLTTKKMRDLTKRKAAMGSSYIFLANLVMIANERHNARLAPRINGTVWPQSATQRVR
jgi:hypothetical protein